MVTTTSSVQLRKRRGTTTSPLFPYTTLFRSRAPSRRPAAPRPARRPPSPRRGRRRGSSASRTADRAEPVGSGSSFRSEEHTSELQSLRHLVCRLLLEKKKKIKITTIKPNAKQ